MFTFLSSLPNILTWQLREMEPAAPSSGCIENISHRALNGHLIIGHNTRGGWNSSVMIFNALCDDEIQGRLIVSAFFWSLE